jgi:hypothetical protein
MELEDIATVELIGRCKATAQELRRSSGRLRRAVCGAHGSGACTDDAFLVIGTQEDAGTGKASESALVHCRAAQEAAEREEVAAQLLQEEALEQARREAKKQQRRKGKAKGVAAAKPAGEHLDACFRLHAFHRSICVNIAGRVMAHEGAVG